MLLPVAFQPWPGSPPPSRLSAHHVVSGEGWALGESKGLQLSWDLARSHSSDLGICGHGRGQKEKALWEAAANAHS